MILQQAMMQLSKPKNVSQGELKITYVPTLVMLSEYGLAIHKNEDNKTYTISHFNSGKSVVTGIKERKDVEGYIKKLIDILPSWQFTIEEFDNNTTGWEISKAEIKVKVDAIQKEILQGEKA
jgi:TATA-box binding protein (TBP) (component of TFIID and TFIIIB)